LHPCLEKIWDFIGDGKACRPAVHIKSMGNNKPLFLASHGFSQVNL